MGKRVYLAGPDVFHPDSLGIFAERREICRRFDLEALVPVDDGAQTALEIYESNVAMLGSSDGVIANVTPFRGPHCDVGTAWEMGYAVARAIPVFAFSATSEPLIARIAHAETSRVEPFGLPENLMIVECLSDRQVHPSFEAAAAAAARRLGR
jgi:nucleoside 2-deoxyribosyltransferase